MTMAARECRPHTDVMESGTLLGVVVAVACMAAAVAGVGLMRLGRPSSGLSQIVAPAVGVVVVCAATGTVIVALVVGGYLHATVASCPAMRSEMVSPSCGDASELSKQAIGPGLLGGVLLGLFGGCVAAWWRFRSAWFVAGGLLTAAGASVLGVETLVVLALWAA
jgi:hypothetical protein